MYNTIADVQEKNDAVTNTQKNNDVSCKCTMQMNKLQKGVVNIKYVPTKEQVADVLTKPLSRVNFEYFWDNIGVVQKDLPRKREWRRGSRFSIAVAW